MRYFSVFAKLFTNANCSLLSMSTKQGINFILDSAQDPQNISFLVGNKNNPAAQSILASEDNPTIAHVTPARTLSISGLKSRVLKLSFLT